MKKDFYALISLFIFFGFFVLAQEPFSEITFPIPELGNCQSREDCEAFCDLAENMEACLDFAKEHNLIPEEEIEMARKMLAMGDAGGPGGCKGKAECEAYCDNPDHMEECIIFAKEYGLIPPDELEEVEKILAAIQKGAKPPACHGKAACDAYCNMAEHFEECITFGEAAGLIPPDEIEDARRALEAVKKGVKPPACKGKAECDAYCAEPEHIEECLTFAEAAGFISPEEAAMARKTGGKGPGGCRGKEACDAFCEDPANMEECISFGLEYGFIPPEEVEGAKAALQALKKGVAPPNCRGEEECDIYCSQPEHAEECINFSEAAGFISPEEAEQARKMAQAGIVGGPGGCKRKEECEAYCEDPEHMEECIDFAVRAGFMTPEEAEQAKRGMQMMQMGGPGGCKSEAECQAYCEDPSHAEECIRFSMEQGFISPEEGQRMLEMLKQPPPEMMGPPPGEMGPPPEGEMFPPEGEIPPEEMMGPPEEEMIPQEEVAPPPTEQEPPPQSLFEAIEQFLANVAAIFGF